MPLSNSPIDTKSVQAPLSDSISTYLTQRGTAATPFFFGDWLQTLADAELQRLRALVSAYRKDDSGSSMDELVTVTQTAIAAEQLRPSSTSQGKLIHECLGGMYLTTAIESFRRRGWLLIKGRISIFPDKMVSINITPEGMKHQEALKAMAH